jgi:hypothetical protein
MLIVHVLLLILHVLLVLRALLGQLDAGEVSSEVSM